MTDETNGAGAARDGTGTGTDGMAGTAGQAADAMRDAGDRARAAFSDHVVDPARRAGEAMRASGQKVADGSAAIGLKIIEQAERNSHEAFEAMREAAKAKDLGDVMRIQGDYLRMQSQRSMDQAREIGELIMQFGRDAVAPLRPGGGERAE